MRIQIEQRIGVRAAASEIWRHLADLDSWPAWNPMYPEASGRLRIGGALSLKEVIPGGAPERITPSIVDWVPESQLVWTSKSAGGLVRRTRYLEIQKLTEEGCVFSNGEIYEGLLAAFVTKSRRRALRTGFRQLCEALKTRVEGPSGAPTAAGA